MNCRWWDTKCGGHSWANKVLKNGFMKWWVDHDAGKRWSQKKAGYIVCISKNNLKNDQLAIPQRVFWSRSAGVLLPLAPLCCSPCDGFKLGLPPGMTHDALQTCKKYWDVDWGRGIIKQENQSSVHVFISTPLDVNSRFNHKMNKSLAGNRCSTITHRIFLQLSTTDGQVRCLSGAQNAWPRITHMRLQEGGSDNLKCFWRWGVLMRSVTQWRECAAGFTGVASCAEPELI